MVWRTTSAGQQFLVLHDAEIAGNDDWAWRPPSGCAEADEAAEMCAARELWEETGLDLDLEPVQTSGLWPVFLAEAPHDAEVVLSHEHDHFRWLAADDAVALVKPDGVATDLRTAIDAVQR